MKKIKETRDVYSFIFKPSTPVTWKAGQFIYYKIPHKNVDNRGDERHFTIASAPHEKDIMLTSKFDFDNGSSFKKALLSLKQGDKVSAYNINGSFTVNDYNKKYVFIAGGIGITPYRSILLDLSRKDKLGDIILLYANSDEENIAFKGLLENLESRHEGLKVHFIIYPKLIDAKVIKGNVGDIGERTFYISGPIKMVKSVESELEKLGVNKEKIVKDYFPGYRD
ncbi:MAG: FAD-dependent oxidoreductase [Actinomycetota bacterium]